jgi:hypothetical protein
MLRDEDRLNQHEVEVVTEAKKALHDLINRFTPNAATALAKEMANDHRTLVQSAMRDFVLPFIQELARQGDEKRWDDRNEGSVKLAMAFRSVTEDSLHPDFPFYLPFI